MAGDYAELHQSGKSPWCAMMQVAADDTYDDYVICRGFDPRILKFVDYASGDANKPGISVAKPFGKRTTGTYEIGEIYPAFLPTQGHTELNEFKQGPYFPPSPVAVKWRVGQNPGVVTGGLDGGQPENLTDEIGILYDHNGKVVNWLLIDSKAGDDHFLFTLSEDMGATEGLAEIRSMDDATQVEASAEVKNTLGDFSHLKSGDRGICVKVDGVYYSVHPEGGAVGVTITLTADIAGTMGATATATVDVSGDPDTAVSSSVTVYNTTTKKAYAGAKGWAVKINGVWWLVEIDQYALLSLATLSSDTHDISDGYTNQGSVARKQATTVSALVAISSYPDSFIPGTLPDLDNPRNLLGLSGDKATVAYNRTNDKWEILELRPATARLAKIKLTASWPVGVDASSTSFDVIGSESIVGGEIPTITTVKDVYSLAMNAKGGDTGLVRYNYVTESWELVSITHTATMWRGTIDSTFSGTPATFAATPVAAYNGAIPSGSQTIQNIYGWSDGTATKKVAVIWNPNNATWEPLQMGCP